MLSPTCDSFSISPYQNNRSQKFCRQHFLNYKGLLRALSIRKQLSNVLKRFGLKIESCNGKQPLAPAHHRYYDLTLISTSKLFLFEGNGRLVRQCITKGIFANAARLHPTGIGVYRTVRDNHELYIHPTSVLYREVPPEW